MIKRIYLLFIIIILGIISLVSIDILSLEIAYSSLEDISTIIGNTISKEGGITNSIRQYVKKEINGDLYCALDDCTHIKSGDTYIYIIYKEVNPIIISYKPINIKVKKSVVIK